MSDEKLRILQMIQDGTISPEEGLELIKALDSTEKAVITRESVPVNFEPGVGSEDAGDEQPEGSKRKKVNIKIPIALAKFAGKFVPKHAHAEMREHGIDLDVAGLMDALEKEGEQNLVEVDDDEGKKVVRIYTQ